jgi:hypothetical protein
MCVLPVRALPVSGASDEIVELVLGALEQSLATR